VHARREEFNVIYILWETHLQNLSRKLSTTDDPLTFEHTSVLFPHESSEYECKMPVLQIKVIKLKESIHPNFTLINRSLLAVMFVVFLSYTRNTFRHLAYFSRQPFWQSVFGSDNNFSYILLFKDAPSGASI